MVGGQVADMEAKEITLMNWSISINIRQETT